MGNVCGRCGRGLSDPVSIRRGFGPVCWEKQVREWESREKTVPYDSLYDGGDVVLKRVNGVACANVPHMIVRHSPTGYEWGYGGSGPADLSLNILLAVTGDRKKAERFYQAFKWDVIANIPKDGGVISKDAILQWVRKKEEELTNWYKEGETKNVGLGSR